MNCTRMQLTDCNSEAFQISLPLTPRPVKPLHVIVGLHCSAIYPYHTHFVISSPSINVYAPPLSLPKWTQTFPFKTTAKCLKSVNHVFSLQQSSRTLKLYSPRYTPNEFLFPLCAMVKAFSFCAGEERTVVNDTTGSCQCEGN